MPADPAAQAVHIRIEGRVQGVWFRGWTAHEAAARGLRGWVRNRGDGSVEAVFAGPRARVADMVALCRRGPPAAKVFKVTTEPVAVPDETGFHVWPTV
jgi:acylphosphatase